MTHFVVLLRGVNVGKGNRLPMADFKALLEGLGFSDVRTLLTSGNAVAAHRAVSADKHARSIAAAVRDRFGFDTPVIVKPAAAFVAIVDRNPIVPPPADHSCFLVAVGPDEAALEALRPLLAQAQLPERTALTAHAAYLHCPQGILESKVATALLGKAGRGVTTRNWATVTKLAGLLTSTRDVRPR